MSLTGSFHVSPSTGVPTPTHIAVLDDEPDITLLLSGYLGTHGFRTTQLHSGRALMELMANDPPQLVLLDLGLPGEDGFAIARQLREHWRCGLVIVTGRGDAVDKVVGLEIGADDYVTKPFDLRELVARVKAVLRRLQAEPAQGPAAVATSTTTGVPTPAEDAVDRDLLHFEGWSLDIAARRLNDPNGGEVMLTTGEFDLLLTFAQHPGRVLSRDFLLERTRGRESSPFDRTIDVQVGRLRRKLGTDPNDSRWIKSIRGAGYLFVPRVTTSRGQP
ncbi:response regulator transcription factor [Roseateles sp. SL47]|jgi:two-component system, OmpR family, response regulator|uniref:winged helix-turn-helix domain-containing protein n=1 Tax=Roseateles sp. SL47 TaxID=2995138 RepID=UPI002271F6B3|nr:response regulator transcription factor [Roseateles sp. SL47]WAC71779.1 response regulator transcription factor [Roseateles sp. SL47]